MQRHETYDATSARRSLYRRELPGAGYVAIDVAESDAETPGEASCIRVYVERRASKERRVGHAPPVLAEVMSDDRARAIGDLYRMASDNVAIARGLLEWQARRHREQTVD